MLERIDAALRASQEGIVVFDSDGNIAYASSIAEKLLDVQHNAAGGPRRIGAKLVDFARQSPLESLTTLTAEQLPLLVKATTGAGNESILRVSGIPAEQTFILHDLTQQIRSGDTEHEFLDIVAHDLRAGLVPIKTYTQMLLTGLLGSITEKQAETLKSVDTCVQRQVEKITAVSDLAKVEQNKLEIRREPVNLAEILTRAADTVRKECTRRGINLVLQLDERMALVEGDEDRLRRVFAALFARAARQCNQGNSLGLELNYIHNAPGLAARVRIWDTGIGRPDADLDALQQNTQQQSFQRFLKEKSLAHIDMATVPEILRQHRARLSSNIEPDAGSTVIVYLPLLSKTLPPRPAPQSFEALLATGETSALEPLRERLAAAGLQVTMVAEHKLAVNAARAKHFHLIALSDTLAEVRRTHAAIRAQRLEDPQASCIVYCNAIPAERPTTPHTWFMTSSNFEKEAGPIVSAIKQYLSEAYSEHNP